MAYDKPDFPKVPETTGNYRVYGFFGPRVPSEVKSACSAASANRHTPPKYRKLPEITGFTGFLARESLQGPRVRTPLRPRTGIHPRTTGKYRKVPEITGFTGFLPRETHQRSRVRTPLRPRSTGLPETNGETEFRTIRGPRGCGPKCPCNQRGCAYRERAGMRRGWCTSWLFKCLAEASGWREHPRPLTLIVSGGTIEGCGACHPPAVRLMMPRGVVVARQPLELKSLVRAQAGQPPL